MIRWLATEDWRSLGAEARLAWQHASTACRSVVDIGPVMRHMQQHIFLCCMPHLGRYTVPQSSILMFIIQAVHVSFNKLDVHMFQ